MSQYVYTILLALIVLTPAIAYAQQESDSVWFRLVLSWVPLIVIIGLFWLLFRRMRWFGSGDGNITDRSFQHMDRVEEKLDRIVASLEERSRRE